MANGASGSSYRIDKGPKSERNYAPSPLCARLRPRRALVLCLLILSPLALAERRASRLYTTADGLPSNSASCTHQDSHGFIWCTTSKGLSRFDGYSFTNYGVDQGLPDRYVSDFLETRSGDYWVGTARGLAKFNPKPGPNASRFTLVGDDTLKKASITGLLEDHRGMIWVAIGDSVYQLNQSAGRWGLHRIGPDMPAGRGVDNMLDDVEGNLWIARYTTPGTAELWRRTPDGRLEQFHDPFLDKNGMNRILSMLQDRQKNIWLGTYQGLALLVPHPTPGEKLIQHVWARWDPARQPDTAVGAVFEMSDGRLLVGAYATYQVVLDALTRTAQFKLYYQGLWPPALEDGYGNFWAGPQRIPVHGFKSYGRADGLATEDIRSVFEGHDGELYVVTGRHTRYIHRFDGTRFVAVAPFFPGHGTSGDWGGWGWGQIHLQDHLGEWWVATGYGLLQYPKVNRLEDLAHTAPRLIRPVKSDADVFRLYEDSRGNIWVGAWGGSGMWERSTQQFRLLNGPGQIDGEPYAFREDRAGNVWIGSGTLQRYRAGQFNRVLPPYPSPVGGISSLFLDHLGRMWVGTSRGGLLRFDDPAAEKPTYKTYTTKEGLSSDNVLAITEDHYGRIYFWTDVSIDRLDPITGRIRHYIESDGLTRPVADHNVAYCDRQGRLWFGLEGMSRLDPEPDPPVQPPPIRITRVRVRGVDHPVSELGETDLSGLLLQPNENQLQIEFASINLAAGEVIKYQYKLEAAENDWSAPSDLRTVNYPRLSSGRYRFLVRAVNAEGLASAFPAVIDFRLLPPIWMRWWFLTMAVMLCASGIYWLYRFRLRQLLELERVRTRIASDLHDDIGSSLTQIAIMSEVARRQNGHRDAEPLERIADLSRELVDSMSDIVWAINPKRDQLSDLIQRMRRFANDVLEAADIEVSFRTLPDHNDAPLQADLRRELFLIFKESVNNIARHSRCSQADIVVEIKGSRLMMKINDNGRGFQPEQGNGQGHGLASMRERARRLGGDIELNSESGKGTALILVVPLDHSSFSIHRAALRH